MSVDVTVLADQHPNVLTIPSGSVTQKNGKQLVKVLRQKRLVQVPVELGVKQGKNWEVKSGLKAGDKVAVPKMPMIAMSNGSSTGARPRGGMMFGGR
jgi:multidrug efflux pump subunit AcrA (membrane-fusion protein)